MEILALADLIPPGARPRPGWDEYFMGIAEAAAARADCTRAKVGAVIVDSARRIAGAGYNGAPPGVPGCLEGACPRGRHYRQVVAGQPEAIQVVCACGNPWPCHLAASPNAGDYEDCISLHAELNAVIYAGRDRCSGATIYVTRNPCSWCMKVIMAAGIARVVVP